MENNRLFSYKEIVKCAHIDRMNKKINIHYKHVATSMRFHCFVLFCRRLSMINKLYTYKSMLYFIFIYKITFWRQQIEF